MTLKSRFQSMAALIEFLVGGGLGIFFHWGLHNKDASYTIFGFGTLMSLATYLLREEIVRVRKKLQEQYRQSHEITFALAGITDPDCHAKAQEILSSISRHMPLLQKGYIPLDETEFYLEAARGADGAKKSIQAVDSLNPRWTTTGGILNFYEAHLRGVRRGLIVRKIFLISREDFVDSEVQKIILTQLADGIEVRVAFRDELPPIRGWGAANSFNFTIFDEKLVIDAEAGQRSYFGKKTAGAGEVQQYLRLLHLVEHAAHRVVVKEGGAAVAGEFGR